MKRFLLMLGFALLPLCIQAQEAAPKIRVDLQGGLATRVGKVDNSLSDDLQKYVKGLKRGTQYGADAIYFLSNGYGFGIKYSKFNSSNSAYGSFTYDDGTSETGWLSDRIGITFIGPFMTYSTAVLGTSHVLMLNAGIGYLGYRDDSAAASQTTVFSGSTMGSYLGFAYDYRIGKHLAFGAEVSAISGSLSSLKQTQDGVVSDVDMGDSTEGLLHLGIEIGIRYYL